MIKAIEYLTGAVVFIAATAFFWWLVIGFFEILSEGVC